MAALGKAKPAACLSPFPFSTRHPPSCSQEDTGMCPQSPATLSKCHTMVRTVPQRGATTSGRLGTGGLSHWPKTTQRMSVRLWFAEGWADFQCEEIPLTTCDLDLSCSALRRRFLLGEQFLSLFTGLLARSNCTELTGPWGRPGSNAGLLPEAVLDSVGLCQHRCRLCMDAPHPQPGLSG